MIVCGLDLETTGLSPVDDRVTEVGLVLYDSDLQVPLRVTGFLVEPDKYIPQETQALNGISDDLVDEWGWDSHDALLSTVDLMHRADVVCAHNGTNFDKPFVEEWGKRERIQIPDKTWIDTRTDLPVKGTRLVYMCAEHAHFVNPYPHRAVFDVMAMLRLLSCFDADAVVARAKLPNIILRALVSFDNKDKAKELGYQWRDASVPRGKAWLKTLKQGEEAAEIAAAREAGFEATVYEG